MKKAPKIGARVRYTCVLGKGETWEQTRTVTGTVTRLWPEHDDKFDDDCNLIQRGSLKPEKEWSASVKVDERPDWWAYGKHDTFCPDVKELEPL